jgi:hypothetical protein
VRGLTDKVRILCWMTRESARPEERPLGRATLTGSWTDAEDRLLARGVFGTDDPDVARAMILGWTAGQGFRVPGAVFPVRGSRPS